MRKISLNCPSIDEILSNDIATGSITEVGGESTTVKHNYACKLLCVHGIHQHLVDFTVYLST